MGDQAHRSRSQRQFASKTGDVRVHRAHRAPRRLLAPNRVDQSIDGDRLALRGEQLGEQHPLLRPADGDRRAATRHQQRTEHLELDHRQRDVGVGVGVAPFQSAHRQHFRQPLQRPLLDRPEPMATPAAGRLADDKGAQDLTRRRRIKLFVSEKLSVKTLSVQNGLNATRDLDLSAARQAKSSAI